MKSKFDRARIEALRMDAEIDHEATELVRRGVPLWEAIERARAIVSARREREAREKETKETRP